MCGTLLNRVSGRGFAQRLDYPANEMRAEPWIRDTHLLNLACVSFSHVVTMFPRQDIKLCVNFTTKDCPFKDNAMVDIYMTKERKQKQKKQQTNTITINHR